MTLQSILEQAGELPLADIIELITGLENLREQKSAEAEQEFIAEMSERANELGLSMENILVHAKKRGGGAKGKKPAGQAPYQNTDNPSQTWAGKGRKPAWLQEQLALGRDISEFKVGS